ncbi:hypothetical protein PVAP13_8NG073600 [Panicum virgatum]|uniref:Uncharacterized protein n=1 Tax=Panicum virgatum TaxID=38727 RepID=A0A8T0P2L8_PANVG|nr:hypothetical protein PVAP13_8NG073600 [Panicum virgatum]
MVLRFRRWSRLTMADGESMRYRVFLEIRGILAHAWSAATAQVILGDACAVPEPTPTTAARADPRCFQVAIWCCDPDLIPNEAVIRIPDRRPGLGNNVIFLRPEEIIYHDLPMLRYKVEIEILEIHDWNDDGSSDDSGTLPDRVLSDSDVEDDYPGFHQRSRSGPWPRRTVFRSPGYGDGVNQNTVDGDATADGAPEHLMLGGVPANLMLGGSLFLPLRFGPSSSYRRCSAATALGFDEAAIIGNESGCSCSHHLMSNEPLILYYCLIGRAGIQTECTGA